MLSKRQKQAIYSRLMEYLRENGGVTRQQLIEMMSKAQCPLTSQALSAYASGRSAPNAETAIGLRKVSGISIDYLYTGDTPPAPEKLTKDALRKVVEDMLVEVGGSTPDKDPIISQIAEILDKLDKPKRETILQLVRQMAERSETTKKSTD